MFWFLGAFLAFSLVSVSYYLKLLTLGGAVSAFIIGTIVFGVGKISLSFPIIYFFVTSILLGKLRFNNNRRQKPATHETERRNALQVLANGFIPALLLVFWVVLNQTSQIVLYLTAVSAAVADTWATEAGGLSKTSPRCFINFKPIPKGTSGGVSLLGSTAAVAGAFSTIYLSSIIIEHYMNLSLSWFVIWSVTCVAVLSQFFDSFLGACCQARYRCDTCKKITEKKRHCENASFSITSGKAWMTNDMVNFLSIALAVLLCLGLNLEG